MNWNLIDKLTFVNSDGSTQLRNRFLNNPDPFKMTVDYAAPYDQLLEKAHQKSHYNQRLMEEVFGPRQMRGKKETIFELIQFLRFDGITESEAASQICRLGYRPACIVELLTFLSHFWVDARADQLIAIGSSNERRLEVLDKQRSLWQRVHDFITHKSYPEVSYPITTGGKNSYVELIPGGPHKIDRYTYFLVVHTTTNDSILVDYQIDRDAYFELPNFSKMSRDEIYSSSLGQFFVASDGHLCELVKSEDLFVEQVGGGVLSLGDKGFRHYRPVFK